LVCRTTANSCGGVFLKQGNKMPGQITFCSGLKQQAFETDRVKSDGRHCLSRKNGSICAVYNKGKMLNEVLKNKPGATSHKNNTAVVTWLSIGIAMLMIQILLGGITRLTGSGLSITEWKPLMGAVPPLNQQAWEQRFSKF